MNTFIPPFSQLTSVIIDINPNDFTLKGLSTVSLPTDVLKITSPNGGLLEISSCILQFKVRVIDKSVQQQQKQQQQRQQQSNAADDSSTLENCIFETELELYDKCRNGLIASGQRDLTFSCEPNPSLMSLPKQAMWKIKHFVKKSLSMSAIGDDDEILKPAKMRCHLQWSREIFRSNENKENGHSINGSTVGGSGSTAANSVTNGVAPKRIFTRSRSTGSIIINHRRFSTFRSSDNIQCLVYQFIHKGYRQKTEIWDRLKCPWCALRASNLYILLKHLTLCHGRFKFRYVPGANEQRIDVFVNKRNGDGNGGGAIDPFSRMATRFRGREPHKRTVRTGIIVNRPERQRPRLSEFLSLDTNINRTFYHSFSGLPLKPIEIDINSEDEIDPAWLKKNTIKMIDDFVDVNDGEKSIMKLWNLFVLKHAFVSDAQIPAAAIEFIETYGEFIVTNHLYRNCIIHLTNLFDYGLISAKDHYKATTAMHRILHRNRSLVQTMKERIEEQRDYLRSRVFVSNIGKTENKQKRSVNRVYLANKRRLRSQSRCEPIYTRNKVKRIEASNCQQTQPASPILTPRPVRKLARITK